MSLLVLEVGCTVVPVDVTHDTLFGNVSKGHVLGLLSEGNFNKLSARDCDRLSLGSGES